MLHWVLHQLLKFSLDVLEASNIGPFDVGNFYDRFSESAWSRFSHGVSEVLHGDGQGVEHLGVNGVVLKVDEIHLLSNLLKSSLAAKSCQVSSYVAVSLCGHLLKIQ